MTATNRGQWVYIAAALFVGLLLALVLGLVMSGGKESGEAVEPYISSEPFYDVVIESPPGLGLLRTGLSDANQEPVGVACSTCHADRQAQTQKPLIEHVDGLTEFHTELEFSHGTLSCSSCHHPEDRDQLRLSDGQALAFADVMQLCAQCHSSQYKSYEHGAHGGMNGYWDQSQGERVRNNCVVCHNPHAPAFPTLMPAAPPRDRFFQ